ncbi:MAG: CBS domain-containing protein [Chloroflexi bacterium]|nr:CBS domain-containing protein [Chloroflexota bacterium]
MEVITSHDHADFDALASILGAAVLYPQAIPLLPPSLNRNVRDFLTLYGGELPFVGFEDLPRGRIARLILVDTQNPPTLKGLRTDSEIIFIDHHPLEKELKPKMSYRGGEVGSTTTLLMKDIMESSFTPSMVEATLLLLGIYEDTGSLSYLSTRPEDLRAAAWLLEKGANLEVVSNFLHNPLTKLQKKLYHLLLENAEFHEVRGHTVMIAAAETPQPVEEISTLAHHLRDLHDPQAVFVIVASGGNIHLVARSTSEAVDVSSIAREFGGGGHKRAAAALISGHTLGEVREKILNHLQEKIVPVITVEEIMSHGVHTLPSSATVAEAEEAMRRWGHEGFPVVDGGELVGILTRGQIDRAVHHGLRQEPIVRIMHKGGIKVSPQESVETLQKIMLDQGLGQVPVVDNGQILGIVTRTDLIKLWASPPQPSRAGEIKARMEKALPHNLLAVLHQASGTAQEMGFNLYLVGGFVRDLLLGLPNLDIDLVVEGGAIALARRLAGELKARAHTHPTFGTAKLLFEQEPSPIAPLSSLDLATARTEFYEHPTALPSVERSSIKQDLGRRDFTINTLAISLREKSYGELLDFYGGAKDLEERLIRVLHNLSFVEDPTRILRALRLEQRLGFRLEPRSEELLQGALDLLRRVSGERVWEELEATFQEAKPGKTLDRLQALGVLAHIHPGLHYEPSLDKMLEALPQRWEEWQKMGCRPVAKKGGEELAILSLALLLPDGDTQAARGVSQRLKRSTADSRILLEFSELRARAPQIAKRGLAKSGLYRILAPYRTQVLFLLWLTSDSKAIRNRLELYHHQLACVETILRGDDLREMGVPRGPVYKKILQALRDARLDGKIKTRPDEIALVKRLVQKA